jgi:Cu/Ag efflux pump CusA
VRTRIRHAALPLALLLSAAPAVVQGCSSPTAPPAPPGGGHTLPLSHTGFEQNVEPVLVRQGCDATGDCHGGGIRGTLALSPPGAKDVQVKSPPGAPRLSVKLRTERLTQLGFRPVEVLEAVQTAYQGTVVAQTFHGNRVEDVAVILEEKHRRDPEGIGSLPLRSAQGLRVLLRELADIYPASGRPEILHDGARRRQTITCDVSGVDVGTVVATAAKRIEARVQFPGGTYVEYEGAAASEAKARQQILLHSSMAGVGILMLLTVVFRTWRNLLLVLANLPFALVSPE